jgi:hypothetical protein
MWWLNCLFLVYICTWLKPLQFRFCWLIHKYGNSVQDRKPVLCFPLRIFMKILFPYEEHLKCYARGNADTPVRSPRKLIAEQVRAKWKFQWLDKISYKSLISNLMKILPAALDFHVDNWHADGLIEVNRLSPGLWMRLKCKHSHKSDALLPVLVMICSIHRCMFLQRTSSWEWDGRKIQESRTKWNAITFRSEDLSERGRFEDLNIDGRILSRIRNLRDLKDGFWIWWSNFLDLYKTCYNISQITIFDWTFETSDHTTLIYYSNWIELSSLLLLASRYIASGRTTRKTRPLPSNGCRLLSRIVVRIT